MQVSASIKSRIDFHQTTVDTNGSSKELTIAPKSSGFGSSINGAELLMLSIAACFCNDIYREAGKRNMSVTSVEVMVSSQFGAEGEPGSDVSYQAHVVADASAAEIEDLINHTDKIAEIHNTLWKGINVRLVE